MGEVFGGRYELIDLIGEGGMGAVWRARDLKLNRIVAAKVLRQSDASALLRFVREQGLRVNHPNVIALRFRAGIGGFGRTGKTGVGTGRSFAG